MSQSYYVEYSLMGHKLNLNNRIVTVVNEHDVTYNVNLPNISTKQYWIKFYDIKIKIKKYGRHCIIFCVYGDIVIWAEYGTQQNIINICKKTGELVHCVDLTTTNRTFHMHMVVERDMLFVIVSYANITGTTFTHNVYKISINSGELCDINILPINCYFDAVTTSPPYDIVYKYASHDICTSVCF